jgi:hypothetical protein
MNNAGAVMLRALLTPSCFRLSPSDWMGDPEDEEEEEEKKKPEEDDEEDEDNEGEEKEVPWQVTQNLVMGDESPAYAHR